MIAGAGCAKTIAGRPRWSRSAVVVFGAGDRSQDTLPAVTDFRVPTIDYLGQVARSAEQLGYEAVLTPTGT